MNYKRIFAAAAACSMLLCGCQKHSGDMPADPAVTTETIRSTQNDGSVLPVAEDTLTNIARSENFSLPEGISSLYEFRTAADGVHCLGFGAGADVYLLDFTPDLASHTKNRLVTPASYDGYHYTAGVFCFGEDALYSIAVMENHSNMEKFQEGDENYDWDRYNSEWESDYLLCTYGFDGTLKNAVPVEGLEDYRDQYGYNKFSGLYHTADCCFLLLYDGTALRVDADGTLTQTYKPEHPEDVLHSSFITDRDGKPVFWTNISYHESDGAYGERPLFCEFDTASGKPGESICMLDVPYSVETCSGGYEDYLFFAPLTDGLYGIREDGSQEMVIDWKASDLPKLDLIAVLPDGSFLTRDYTDSENPMQHIRRRYASEIQQTEQLTLTIGVLATDEGISGFARDFNRSQDAIRLETKVYSNSDGSYYGDPEGANDALDSYKLDIISGDAPDLVLMYENHEAIMQLGKRGAFLDLYDFMTEDAQIRRDNVLPNGLTAMETENGALYSLPNGFSITTMAVKSRLCDKENWTVEDMITLYADAGEAQYKWHSKREMLEILLEGTDFTDEENGTCSFDSPEFVKILEFCSRYPTETAKPPKDYDDPDAMAKFEKYHYDLFLRYQNDEDYLCPAGLSWNPNMLASAYSYTRHMELAEEFTYVGYPSEDGRGGKVDFNSEVCITSACEHPQEAWQVMERLLLEYDDIFAGGYSIMESEFENQLDAQMKVYDFGKEAEYIEDDGMKIYPMTQEERDRVERYIRSCDTALTSNETVLNIVLEEAEMYFAGDCTAEDAAKRIQSRAEIYVSEQS